MNKKLHNEVVINKQSYIMKREYKIHLTSTIETWVGILSAFQINSFKISNIIL